VIFFLGVLYHVEDVFGCMRRLGSLLAEEGTIYLETQLSAVACELPIFEYASDTYATVVRQERSALNAVGLSNYLVPNEPAIRNLADSYGFQCVSLTGPRNRYTQDHPTRGLYRLVKAR
jgi:hypothetical protein